MNTSEDSKGHHHHHHHEGGHANIDTHEQTSLSVAEKNRRHWDSFAATYTSAEWQEQINKIVEFILTHINWIGVDFIKPETSFESSTDTSRRIRVLDYACGPGTITSALGNRATEYIGIDLSDNMIKAYNARFASDSNSEQIKASGVVGNLLDEGEVSSSLTGPNFFDFDLVVVGMGYHHFDNLPHSTQRLVDRLKPGGIFLIIDLVTHAKDENHPASHTVMHHGFSEDEVRKIFKSVGLVDIDVVRMNGQILMRGISSRTPFMARGRKPEIVAHQ